MNLSRLTQNEMTVLYWKCKGLKHEQIANRLGYGVDWVQLQMSTVYQKLGFDKNTHWTKRKEILSKEICPKLPKDLKDWKPEEPEEVKPDPEMLAIVLYDQTREENTEETQPNKVVLGNPQPIYQLRRRNFGVLVIILIIGLLLLILGGLGFVIYKLTQIPATEIVVITASPLPSPIPTLSPTQAQTDTPLPDISPTLPPDAGITATPFIVGYYDQGQWVELRPGVFVTLDSKFNNWEAYGTNVFTVNFLFRKQTQDQFILRFDPNAFTAVDDLGNSYTLKFVHVNLREAIGVQNVEVGSFDRVIATFNGSYPLDAKYIVITAEMNGVKLIFRKDL